MSESSEGRTGIAIKALLTLAWCRFRHSLGWKGPVSARFRAPTHAKQGRYSFLTVLVGAMLLFQSFFMSDRMIETFAERSLARGAGENQIALDDHTFRKVAENAPAWAGMSDEEIQRDLSSNLWFSNVSREHDGGEPFEAEEILAAFREQGLRGFRNIGAFAEGKMILRDFGGEARAFMSRLLGMIFLLLLIALLFMPLAVRQKDLAATSDHQEWLFSLPLKESELLGGTFLSSVLIRPLLYIILWPLLTNLLLANGASIPVAALTGMVIALLLSVAISAVELSLDTWMRARAPGVILRNAQMIFSVVGLASFYLVLAASLAGPRSFPWVKWLAETLPGELGQPVGAVLMAPLGLLVVTSCGLALCAGFGGFALAGRFLRSGWLSGHGLHSHDRRPPRSLKKGSLVKFEGLLLLRNRTLAMQVILVPVLIVGYQVLINPMLVQSISAEGICAMAYGCGTYASLITAPQLLMSESKGMWLIYNLPVPVAAYFRRRETLWRSVATAIAGLLIAVLALSTGEFQGEDLTRYLIALLGVWVMGRVVSGVVMGQPKMPDVAAGEMSRIGFGRMYGAMILAGIFGGLLWQGHLWPLISGLVIFWFLGLAIWQRRNISFNYLLEPVEKEPPSWGVDDGLWTVVVFFVVQTGVLIFWAGEGVGGPILFSYLAGGLAALAFAKLKGDRKGLPLPELSPDYSKIAGKMLIKETVLATLLCLAVGAAWLQIIESGAFGPPPEVSPQWHPAVLLLLAVGAAPVFEELLFRGFICRTMLAFWSPGRAILGSSLIFAMVHPGTSFPPVFLLGLATAWLYFRSRSVLPGMILHALYNLGIAGMTLAPWL